MQTALHQFMKWLDEDGYKWLDWNVTILWEVVKMTGKVISYFEKKAKTGKTYLNVQMEVEGATVQYLCTDEAAIEKVMKSVNETMEFYTFKSKDGTATFMALPKGTKQPSPTPTPTAPDNRNNSFALSYAKDIVCHCIDKGIITKSTEIDATLKHYFTLCQELLG